MMKLFDRKRKTFAILASMVLLALLASACGSANTGSSSNTPTSSGNNGKGCKKVGVLLPETATSARWDSKDRPLLTQGIKNALSGATVDYNNAEGSATEQQNQANADLTKGDCILVLAPVNGQTAAAIVTKAKQQGVLVIAYDRLIQSKDTAFYVSFDNVRVGELQGQYIVDHYKDYVKGPGHNNLVMINGGQTDNNAILFRQGALNKLQPLISSGALNKLVDEYTPMWDNATAQNEMQGALTSHQN